MAEGNNHQGRKLLFSELFKDPKELSSEKKKKKKPPSLSPSHVVAGDHHNFPMMMSSSSSEFGSPGSSLSLTSGSFLGSELGSTTTDSTSDDEGDKDFIAELTKQMADYMLNDDGDEEIVPENPHQEEGEEGEFGDSGKLENRDREKGEQILQNGSGMRAVFLGRSGSRIESSGTGVFLPRGTPLISEPRKKKSVCSTVLVPARVLHLLQHHFANSNIKPAIIQSNGLTSQYPSQSGARTVTRKYTQQEKNPQHHSGEQQQQQSEDVFLPKEWIY